MNKTFNYVRSLVWDKPKALLQNIDISAYFCEETCRVCGRSVSDLPETSISEGTQSVPRASSGRHSKPADDAQNACKKRFCLCYECHAKFLCNRQSIWWLPIPGEMNASAAASQVKTDGTVSGTRQLLPVVTAGMYEGVMQKLIRKLKYDDDRLVVNEMSVLLQRAFQKLQTEVEAYRQTENVIIVPIPLHRSREQKRGYNQASLLAKDLAAKNKLSVSCNLLKRVKNTKPQFGLNKQDRLTNIDGAFALGKVHALEHLHALEYLQAELHGKSIILIDDVFTSGATLTLCAKLLTAGGASNVAAIAAARAPYDR